MCQAFYALIAVGARSLCKFSISALIKGIERRFVGHYQRFLVYLYYPYIPSYIALVIWCFVPDTHSQCAPQCIAVLTRCAEAAGGGSFSHIRP